MTDTSVKHMNGKAKKFKIKVLARSGVVKEYITTVDEQDAYLLRSEFWTIINGASPGSRDENGRKYVAKNKGGNEHEYLHYRVLGLLSRNGSKVYHINGDTLDNRRANLLNGAERIEEIE